MIWGVVLRSHVRPPEHPPRAPDPRCRCGKPLLIDLRPGQHIHPCPVHPERFIVGPRPTFRP